MKVCSIVYGNIYIELRSIMGISDIDDFYACEMPVGMFSNCLASSTCGMVDEMGYIGDPNDPSAFSCFFDEQVSKITIADVLIPQLPYIKICVGVDENALIRVACVCLAAASKVTISALK